MEAAEARDVTAVLSVAERAFGRALDDASADLVVFDRSWLTVATLIPSEAIDRIAFKPPTALCWADLATTLKRLHARREDQEDERWHSGYIAQYLDIANRYGCPVIHTDECTETEATEQLAAWFEALPSP